MVSVLSLSDLVSPQEPTDVFSSTLDSGLVGSSTLWSSNPLHAQNQNQFPPVYGGSSRSLNQSSDAQRQNIYENFMQELGTGYSSAAERTESSEGDGEEDEGELDIDGEVEQLDVLFEKEQGVVRRAGWLSFKALITVNKDRKLELVSRRRWRHFWVTLKGTDTELVSLLAHHPPSVRDRPSQNVVNGSLSSQAARCCSMKPTGRAAGQNGSGLLATPCAPMTASSSPSLNTPRRNTSSVSATCLGTCTCSR